MKDDTLRECEDCDRAAVGICNNCCLPVCGCHSTTASGRLECLQCHAALHPAH